MYVVMHHCKVGHGTWLSYFTMQGQAAVMLFFIVSGFVIYYSVHKTPELAFKTYFWKRFKRIYFILIIALIISYLAACIKAGEWLPPNLRQLAVNLLNLQDLNRHPGYIDFPYFKNTPLWSLTYEWWFYMLFFPIFKLLKGAKQDYFVLGLSVFGILSYWCFPNQFSIILWYFIIWWWGVILAKVYIKNEGKAIRWDQVKIIPISFFMFLCMMAGMIFSHNEPLKFSVHPIIELRHFIYSFGILIIGWIWYKIKLKGFKQLIGPFEVFAPISYAIYVFHYPLVVLLRKEFFDQIWLHYLVAVLLSLILAYVAEKKLYPYVSKRI